MAVVMHDRLHEKAGVDSRRLGLNEPWNNAESQSALRELPVLFCRNEFERILSTIIPDHHRGLKSAQLDRQLLSNNTALRYPLPANPPNIRPK